MTKFQNRLREIRNQEVIAVTETKEDKPKGYTLDELEKSLFDKNSEVIKPFTEITKEDKVSSEDLFIAPLAEDTVINDVVIEKGHYIGYSLGLASEFNSKEEIQVKSLYEHGHKVQMLAKIDTDKTVYRQKDLLEDVKKGTKFVEEDSKDVFAITKSKVDYLKLVDKDYFSNLIEDVLSNYHNLSDPDGKLKTYIKAKDMLSKNTRMIYCPLLDICVGMVGVESE